MLLFAFSIKILYHVPFQPVKIQIILNELLPQQLQGDEFIVLPVDLNLVRQGQAVEVQVGMQDVADDARQLLLAPVKDHLQVQSGAPGNLALDLALEQRIVQRHQLPGSHPGEYGELLFGQLRHQILQYAAVPGDVLDFQKALLAAVA